jgi:hypothetical protein
VVHPEHPRYLMVKDDPAKKIVYLTGAHTWAEFQNYQDEKFNYTDWLNKLVGWKHNFMRGWTWEDDYYSPMPFKKVGKKYDLTSYNPAFFDLYKKRLRETAKRKIYVGVMLFQGWSVKNSTRSRNPIPWPRHPYHKNNNINGIDGDPKGEGHGKTIHGLGIPAVTALQEKYVKHFIDELNGFDNIVWEIGNECNKESAKWQYHIIDFIKSYEASKPKQHLVWINSRVEAVFDPQCHAELVSPNNPAYLKNPPVATGKKIVISDSDHNAPLRVTYDWAWKSFARGMMPILMDCGYQGLTWYKRDMKPQHPKWQQMRDALGIMRTYAEKINLVKMIPQKEKTKTPCSTSFCLYQTGKEYLVYQPVKDKPFTVDMPAGKYMYEWINPVEGKANTGVLEAKGGTNNFTAPFPWPAGLYLKRIQSATHP